MAETAAAESAPAVPDYLASPNAVFADEGVQWRYGRAPDYSKTRKVWEEGKKSNHVAGSLPQLVENLVKNWEVEASFKPRLQDWRTIDHDNYSFSMCGGPPQSAEHMLKVGTYNAIIAPNEYYDPSNSDFASSHKTFKRMMPTFAWEVTEVYSGPPVVAFKWRHWGTMKNDYVGFNNKGEKVTAKAHGGPIEIFGVTIAKVDDKVRLQAVDTWMDPLEMFRQIAPHGIVNKHPMNTKVEKAEALDDGPGHNGVKIAEAYNAADATSKIDQTAGADIPKHVSERTGRAADAPLQQVGGCPFIARHGAKPSAVPSEGHPDIHGTGEISMGSGANGNKENHTASDELYGSSGVELAESRKTPTQAAYRETVGAPVVQRDVDMKEPTTVTTSIVSSGSTGSSDTSPTEPSVSQMLIESPPRGGRDCDQRMTPASTDLPTIPDAVSNIAGTSLTTVNSESNSERTSTDHGATQITAMNVGELPHKRAAKEEIPRSIYSSAVTGDVENVITAARSDDYVDESVTTRTYDAVDKHLESSAERVHPHPKTMEDEVKPDPGEAVAVSANNEETRQTYQEMGVIKPEEKELIMNRE